jgi:opacity protein-like surface antigen
MKSYFTAFAAILLCGTAAQAQIDNARYHASVLGGLTSHPRLDLGNGHFGVDSGFNAGARAGINLNGIMPLNGFSLDADYFYNQGGFQGAGSGIDLNSHSLMANLIYNVPVAERWGVYGGAGLGAVHTNLSGAAHGGATVFGWQALGGINYAMNERTSLFAEYRYQNAHNVNIPGTGPVGNTSNSISMGVKISF